MSFVISMANTKGGAGKTTLCLALAQILAANGKSVALLDADPNQPLAAFADLRAEYLDGAADPYPLHIVPNVTEDNVVDEIHRAAEIDYTIIDLEGTANMTMSYACANSHRILIPLQGSQLDANQAARVIAQIGRNGKAFGRFVPYNVIFTRINPAIETKSFRSIRDQLIANDIPLFTTAFCDRAAYAAIFQIGAFLTELTPSAVTSPDKAVDNAAAVAQELVTVLEDRHAA